MISKPYDLIKKRSERMYARYNDLFKSIRKLAGMKPAPKKSDEG